MPTTNSLGILSRLEPLTGRDLSPIAINGDFLYVANCTVYPHQDLAQQVFIQGGPRLAIANFGVKFIEGDIEGPICIDQDGNLDAAIITLINAAQAPLNTIRIDTNNVLSADGIIAENGGTSGNELISMDGMVVKSFTLTADQEGGVKFKASLAGMFDTRTADNLVDAPTSGVLRRNLEWSSCSANRHESLMRSVMSLEITIENEVERLTFFLPITSGGSNRTDQPNFFAVKECKWGGSYEEMLIRGNSTENYMHGGWMVGENLTMMFGPITAMIPVPTFYPSDQVLTSKLLKRKVKFFATNNPILSDTSDMLFTFD